MAFENFPQTEKTQSEVNAPKPSNNNMRNILTGALVAALLGTWGYIIYDKNNVKEKDSQQENLIASTSSERDELQKELEDAAMRYDMLKSSNTKLDSTITAKDREIEEKRVRIQSLLSKTNATESELREAKTLIASMNVDLEGYKNQIEVLQGEKIQLTAEKAAVTRQRDIARKEYDSATVVIKEKEDLLDVGSTLRASNFNITGINEKNKGKEKTTSTAKRVDKLRITFDLDENMISKSGSKEIYVCITAPDGSPVAVEALGSGTFNTRDGQQKFYTQKLDVNYTQNKRQTVSFDWKQNSNFAVGNYRIEVFNNGFKVGEASRPLKKGGLFS
ncbi:MAG TPA: hypothetical protein PK504_02220 [Ferruginibacter sp.]|nr:hypothetical protein [Ferruginibacter sp.]HRE63380.1 hypothetical protein [Ferruginibacter sp.]